MAQKCNPVRDIMDCRAMAQRVKERPATVALAGSTLRYLVAPPSRVFRLPKKISVECSRLRS